MLSLALLSLAAVPVPAGCEQPELHDVAELKALSQQSGALSVGLDSIATWCFDSSGAWTGGQPVKAGRPADPNAIPSGDCARAVASCLTAKAALSEHALLLLDEALADLKRPYRGESYVPRRSGLSDRPSPAFDCRAKDRGAFFTQAQARMDYARLATQTMNEYSGYKSWLLTQSLRCAQEARRAMKDGTRRTVTIEGVSDRLPNFAAGGVADEPVTPGVRLRPGVQVTPAGVAQTGGRAKGFDVPGSAVEVGGGEGGPGAGALGTHRPGVQVTPAGVVQTGGEAGAAGATARGGGDAAGGPGAGGTLTSGSAGALGGALRGGAGALGVSGGGGLATGGPGAWASGSLGGAGVAGMAGGGAPRGGAGSGAPAYGANGAVGAPGGTGASSYGANGAVGGPGGSGASAYGAAGGAGASGGPGATGATGAAANGSGTPGSPGGALVASATAPLAAGTATAGPVASRAELVQRWKTFAARRQQIEADRDYTLGFLASRELRDCRCQRPMPSLVVQALESGAPAPEASDDKVIACEQCVEDSFGVWRTRATRQCALAEKLSEYELGVLERSDDGNGLPPRCLEEARRRRPATVAAPPPPTGPALQGKSSFVVTRLDQGEVTTTAQGQTDAFVRPQDYAPTPMREEGRLYVRLFMSSACVAEILPGPMQARTGDLLLIPYGAKAISVKSPCGGLAEAYWGKEPRPRVSEIFGKHQPLQLEFRAQ